MSLIRQSGRLLRFKSSRLTDEETRNVVRAFKTGRRHGSTRKPLFLNHGGRV